jgi:hypothetical protein
MGALRPYVDESSGTTVRLPRETPSGHVPLCDSSRKGRGECLESFRRIAPICAITMPVWRTAPCCSGSFALWVGCCAVCDGSCDAAVRLRVAAGIGKHSHKKKARYSHATPCMPARTCHQLRR